MPDDDPVPTTTTTDWHWWADAWDRHMAGHLPHRDQPLALLEHLLRGRARAGPVRAVELGGGTGALAVRLCQAVDGVTVTVVDLDPLLQAIGERAHGDAGGRVRRVTGDLRTPNWADAITSPVDVVYSVAALHVLGPAAPSVHPTAASLLRPNGLLALVDMMAEPHADTPLDAALDQAVQARLHDAEPTDFWQHEPDLLADPVLADLEQSRRAAFGPRPDSEPAHPTHLEHVQAIAASGLTTIRTPWRHLDVALILATRGR